ncbi:TetR/AcrR family transcriptional regulator [Sulfurimonas sp. MAG313]|nr:TetR/AcrR family transcriptional regulator [Sulfurimonas sp. MAG313]MDF1881828.1 TetR/AcrR family transcriptional regulator [Sulfurimonas sp. MAG313]
MKIDLREKLINAMFEAIYTKGYHASNLNDILKNAGISKGGLYHHFTSKKELSIAAIEEVLGKAISELWEKPLDVKENYIKNIVACIRSFSHLNEDENTSFDVKFGCPLNNMIQELSVIDDDFASALQNIHIKWHEVLQKALENAKDSDECRSNFNAPDVALFIIASIEGAISSAKVFQNISYYNRSSQELIAYIKGL